MSNEEILNRLAQLESLVEAQQETTEDQQETIETQREQIADLQRDHTSDPSDRLTADGASVKVLGELEAPDGTGVLGRAIGSGETYGVRGETSSSSGYGLSTPDDAQIDGTAELGGLAGEVTGNQEVTDLLGTGLTVDETSNALGLADGGVDTQQLSADAVGSAEIRGNAVGTAELDSDAVTGETVADGAVDSAAIVDGAVTESEVTQGVSTVEIDGQPVSKIETSDLLTVNVTGDTATIGIDTSVSSDVTIDKVNYTDYGQTVEVTSVDYTVTNSSLGTGTQTIEVVLGDRTVYGRNSEEIQLDGLGSTSSTLSVSQSFPVAGLDVILSSEDDTESKEIIT